MFSIDEILKATGGALLSGNTDAPVSGISIDSRTINKGELFVAIKGGAFDGHDFIQEALKKGACGIISSKREEPPVVEGQALIKVRDTLKALGDIAAFHRRRFNIPVIGITGSNGKTTVKEMAAYILGRRYNVLKNKGTRNNLIGLPLTLLGLKQGYHSIAVLEMGANQSGEIKRLAKILMPTVGIITNIGQSHLEFLKDREGVFKAKSEMISELKKDDLVIINGDDTMLSRIRPRSKRIKFGLKKSNDFRAKDIKPGAGITFLLNEHHPLNINLFGMHNIYNALAAIAVASHFGINIPTIAEALTKFKAPSMRMERLEVNNIDIINDAYNSNPLSLKCAVEALSLLKTKGRKILVTGDMLELGAKARSLHTAAGRMIAKSSISHLITIGALSKHTALGAGQSGMNKNNVYNCLDKKEAAGILKRIARPGDTALIKGSRDMRMEKIIELI